MSNKLKGLTLLCMIVLSFNTLLKTHVEQKSNSQLAAPKNFGCTDWTCQCLPDYIVFIQAPPCPNRAINYCYKNYSKCRKIHGTCQFTINLKLLICLIRATHNLIKLN